MKIYFSTQKEAEAFQAKVHQQMIATDKFYSASVAAGQTKRWAVPSQDLDENDKPIDTRWYVRVKDRCMKVLDSTDRSKLQSDEKTPTIGTK